MTRIAVVAGLVRVAAFLVALLLPAQTLVADDEVSDDPQLLVEIIAVVGSGRSEQHPATNVSLEMGVGDERDALGEPLLSVLTDEFGFAYAHIPWSALEPSSRGKRPLIWVRSQSPGMLVRTAKVRAPEPSPDMLTVNVVLQPGGVVEGVILSADGDPVAGEVHLVSEGLWDGLSLSWFAKADSDGRFRGEVLAEGTLALFARGWDDPGADHTWSRCYSAEFSEGSGCSGVIDVRFDEASPFVEIHVAGPGVLRGYVRDNDGHPAAGLRLMALRAGAVRGRVERPLEGETLAGFTERAGGGEREAYTHTDDDGAFLFTGLRKGDFDVSASRGLPFEGYRLQLTEQSVPGDGSPLELLLTRPHLAVHVRHADGSLPTEQLGGGGLRPWTPHETWPHTAALMVCVTPDDTRSEPWLSPFVMGRESVPGEFIVELGDRKSVVVGLVGGAVPWRSERIVVPEDAGRIDVQLTIPNPVGTGALVLDVLDSDDAPLSTGLRVRLLGPQSGSVLLEQIVHYASEETWPLRWDLPEGQYRLVVEGQAKHGDHHGDLQQRREHGAFDALVEIKPGVETQLTAKLNAGARLQLRLIGETNAADRALMRERDAFAPEYEIDVLAGQVSLHLERPGRWARAVDFDQPWLRGEMAKWFVGLDSNPFLGGEATSELLSPGTYTVVARLPAGRTVRRDVVLQPGKTLYVILSFD